MLRFRRPALTDALVLVAVLAVVAGLVVLQATRGSGDDERRSSSATTAPAGGPVTHATLGPSPTPSEPGAATATAAPTPTAPVRPGATGTAGGAAVPQPGAQASDLARSAQSLAATPSMFRIATFNVLGASHTRKKGDSRIKTPYGRRMSDVVRVIANHGVDVVGFQEFESPQARSFARQAGAAWAMYPTAGARGRVDGRQTIAWRTELLELVQTDTVTYPYFHGQTIHTPAVRLRVRGTDDTFWVISVHNPATACAVCGGNNDRWRSAAVTKEIAAIRRLHADGTPVFLVGDMNSKGAFYCQMSAALPVVFAAGGSRDAAGCHPPRPTPIDWILATSGVSFSGYFADDSALVDAASDHPAYSVTAMLP